MGKLSRKFTLRDRLAFEKQPRCHTCLAARERYQDIVGLDKLSHRHITHVLGVNCKSIEHQIITLRTLTQITKTNLSNRRELTQHLIDCLYRHHNVIYEAILFGSSINGLGFNDSDLDLRLRPLVQVGHHELEPVHYNENLTERTLKDIAFRTNRCAPTIGCFVPSTRCPIAKLTLLQGRPRGLREGFSYDISLSSRNSLGSFNSLFIQFLCKLSPKFHLLAVVIRYWSKRHKLIMSGLLSSYALLNLLIVFCQSLDKPLLPTVDQMRDIKIAQDRMKNSDDTHNETRAMTQLEWQCLVCLDKDCYPESENTEPLAVLLLKFFEFSLKLNYADKIITIRSGRALTKEEFQASPHFHPVYPIKEILNMQDPFDLRHNLTCGMTGEHFYKMMETMCHSYEKLHQELLNNFLRPKTVIKNSKLGSESDSDEQGASQAHERNWGLNAIFVERAKK